MRIPSGVSDQYIYFVAVDATDLKTRETGLSTWTVYRSRNGGAAAAMTTPTINETDVTNMPGVYELLLDEDMTIDSGDDSQEMVFHITHAGMAPVTRVIELYRPKITAGNTLDVTATGAAGIDWGNVENPTTAVDLSGTDIQLCDTITTYTGNTVQTGDTYALANGATGFAAIDTVVDAIKVKTDFLPSATAGSAGGVFIAGTNAATSITTGLTANITGNVSGSVGSVTGAVGSISGVTFPTNFQDLSITVTTGRVDVAAIAGTAQTANDNGADINEILTDTGTTIPGTISTAQADLDTITGADGVTLATAQALYAPAKVSDVASELSDALTSDTIAELTTGVPAATPSITQALMLLYMALRNTTNVKTSYTTDAMEISNDAGTVICHKDVTDDGSDYSEAKMQSGASS